jgi:catechol 2,3-dioxygenase-like lactoylglutathione lyase family enzyme
MNPRVHIHLAVSEIARSTAFYEALFGAPVKTKPGYRKFLPGFASLNLAMSEHPPGVKSASPEHFGIQFDTRAQVRDHLARVKAAGLEVREEIGVDCCHANQDKFWVRDPDGVDWEFYTVNHDIEKVEEPASGGTACCATGPAGPGACS